ncbi:MAG TPA: protein phosphatase 2C domain-containing protein [Burkholderiaceae bacterium]|jgi:serine/threonine protein phosphatase PrpC|nr:protein phosphatase 2C domain-containing protein [Burkholderiaceae bacterium]
MDTQRKPAARFKVSACIAEHIGDRAEQQDRVAILTSKRHKGALMAVVADGMGGRSGGRMASDQVLATAESLFDEVGDGEQDLHGFLEQVATEAHTVIRLTAISAEKEPHSTMVALFVRKDYAIWGHAGDSRLYFFRAGRLAQCTQDHTYAAHLRAEGRNEEAAEADKKYKNVLVSALGISQGPKLSVDEASGLRVGDAFLLCSDGLWAYFNEVELGSLVHSLPPRDACDHLVRLARERANGRGDNLSLAIVKLETPETRPHRPQASFLVRDPVRSRT